MGSEIDPILEFSRRVELYGRLPELEACLRRKDYAGALRVCREVAAIDYAPLPGIVSRGLLMTRQQNLDLLRRLRNEIASAALAGQKRRRIWSRE